MKRFSGSREVERALKNVEREVKSALRQVNQQAGKFLARGDYAGAEELVAVGKSVNEFQAEVDAIRRRWQNLRGEGGMDGSQPEKLPLWKYYHPTLCALAGLGGSATRKDIEHSIESASSLQEDLKAFRNAPRWKTMLQRALPAMEKEGFVERGAGKRWKITPAGRKAAEIEESQGGVG